MSNLPSQSRTEELLRKLREAEPLSAGDRLLAMWYIRTVYGPPAEPDPKEQAYWDDAIKQFVDSRRPRKDRRWKMTTITITVGNLEFEFRSKQQWINLASEVWREHGLRDQDTLCIDAKGRICQMGAHFTRAEEDGAYPIKVYRKNPPTT